MPVVPDAPLPDRFAIADPGGVFLTLSTDEARMILEDLRGDDDLSPNMQSLLAQLEEWVGSDEC